MRHTLMIFSAIALLAGASGGAAQAQKLDANGRCHAANGQFAKAEVCGRSTGGMMAKGMMTRGAMAPAAAAPAERSKVPERCKNDKGRFAKCGSPGAHPA